MIIFLYGEDSYRGRQKLNELKGKFRRDVDSQSLNIKTIDAAKAGLKEIREAVSESSLFVRKQLVIIENSLSNKALRAPLYEFLKGHSAKKESDSDNIIIFFDEHSGEKLGADKLFKFLSAQKFSQCFKPLSNTDAGQWVRSEISKRGGKISLRASNTLVGIIGNDLHRLSNEIDKLISYKKALNPVLGASEAQLEISDEDIGVLVRGSFQENIFALTDALSQKNKALSVKLLEQELDNGAAEVYLLHMLTRQFKILLMVKDALARGRSSRQIGADLKLHPFVAQKALAQAGNFSLDALKNLFSSLIVLDKNIKSGQASFRSDLLLLISKL